ncbi:MAG: sulfate adenylyltransferase [Alphaproteobacteria bacterium]|nr:sulfate adenylyltransferase [Alphaproteobacteria bacterium]
MTAPVERDEGGLLRFTTAGSVDDGKSSLIGRLLYDSGAVPRDRLAALERAAMHRDDGEIDLSLLVDGLTIEREQGITIDVAYGYFATPRRKFIIADTPGHEQYTRNMVTGASTADAAVTLVDVRRGMTVQTCRHLCLSHLLRVPHLVVAVNKMDLIGWDRQLFETVARSICEFTARLGLSAPALVPISAKYGDNVAQAGANMPWYRGLPLLRLLEALPLPDPASTAPFRLPVQLVRRIIGDGRPVRQYLGRIETGSVRVGDEVVVMPSGQRTRVRSIGNYDGIVDSAAAPRSVALEVADDLDIARGDLIAAASAPPGAGREFEAMLCWFSDHPFTGEGHYKIKAGTRSVAGRIAEILHRVDVATLAPEPSPTRLARNDIARIRLSLAAPVAVDAYAENRATGAFIVIDRHSNETVAAGMISGAAADAEPQDPADRARPGL